MISTLRFVGLDVHKDSATVALCEGTGGDAKVFTRCSSVPQEVERKLQELGGPTVVRCCYEAGPTGYGLVRHLRAAGYHCDVIAPSVIPRETRRQKTDARDAIRLAHFLRSGDLTPIAVPDEATEAIRDLVRSRDSAKRTERAAKNRLQKFFLRRGRIWSGLTNWTKDHWVWIRAQKFELAALRVTYEDLLATVELATDRVNRLTLSIAELVSSWSGSSLVKALQSFRGISLVTAAVLVSEVGDFGRFASARNLMSYLGLVPSEHSSGSSRRQGSITRTGNSFVRRVLVESAWNYRSRPKLTKAIQDRSQGVSAKVVAIAWKAQMRLNKRYLRMMLKGKNKGEVVVALARELSGFVWAAAKELSLSDQRK
jgi:transposase